MEMTSKTEHYVGHIWDEEEASDNDIHDVQEPAASKVQAPSGGRFDFVKDMAEPALRSFFPGNSSTAIGDLQLIVEREPDPEPAPPSEETQEEELDVRLGGVNSLLAASRGDANTSQQGISEEFNPFLMSGVSEDADTPADHTGGEGPADRFKLQASQRALNELLKMERLHWLRGGYSLPESKPSASIQVHSDQLRLELTLSLFQAARRGSLPNATLALNSGADVHAVDVSFFNWTALHRAADKGSAEVVSLLVYYGADVNQAEDGLGCSPLHLAVHGGRVEAVGVLLKAGADPAQPNRDGLTSRDLAEAASWRSSLHRDILVDLEANLLAKARKRKALRDRLSPPTAWRRIVGDEEGSHVRHGAQS